MDGDEETLQIVGSTEADPANGRISNVSPVGRALIGHRAGDTVEITTPADHVGDVVGDLNRRRGMIQNQESSGSTVIVRAHVPLKEMFGYISHLRSMTKGRASFTMQFHHYDPVPRNIADEIAERGKKIRRRHCLRAWLRDHVRARASVSGRNTAPACARRA